MLKLHLAPPAVMQNPNSSQLSLFLRVPEEILAHAHTGKHVGNVERRDTVIGRKTGEWMSISWQMAGYGAFIVRWRRARELSELQLQAAT